MNPHMKTDIYFKVSSSRIHVLDAMETMTLDPGDHLLHL